MKHTKKIFIIICIVSVFLTSGCTNWKKKYQALDVAYKNLEGQLDYERSQKGALSEQVSQSQQTIDELQRQIAENKSAAEASGFGKGYDVAFDAKAGTVTVTLQDTILFDPGKANLKKATSNELDHIYSVLQSKYSGRVVDVLGHTDTDPIKKSKWQDNWELSSQRALSVTRYMISRGISEDKIRAVGCGPSKPVASNITSSGKAKNRRVEIVVHIR